MSCVLNEAGLASDAAFTIKEHFSTVPGLKFLGEVSHMELTTPVRTRICSRSIHTFLIST